MCDNKTQHGLGGDNCDLGTYPLWQCDLQLLQDSQKVGKGQSHWPTETWLSSSSQAFRGHFHIWSILSFTTLSLRLHSGLLSMQLLMEELGGWKAMSSPFQWPTLLYPQPLTSNTFLIPWNAGFLPIPTCVLPIQASACGDGLGVV